MNLENKFLDFLQRSNELRPQYKDSLGSPDADWVNNLSFFSDQIPLLISAIYHNVSGTPRGIKSQNLMDFIPGFRLIHIKELHNEFQIANQIISKILMQNTNLFFKVIPILANYSSDYVCWAQIGETSDIIIKLWHDSDSFDIIHNSSISFLNTICTFYSQHVYFLDSDGYLDYNYEDEAKIGLRLNPNIEYWKS